MQRSVNTAQGKLVYTLIQTSRHSILLKVLPEGETRVYAPAWMHLRDIDNWVSQHCTEVAAMHERLDEELESSRLSHPVTEGSRVCVEGKDYVLHLEYGRRVTLRLVEDECILTLPEPQNEDKVRGALKQSLSKLALGRIRDRLAFYAPRLGVQFGRVTIRDQKTRWGSCSSKHNLNFNWKLIMAPHEALDYVVIHELCHLIEFNHSPRFWKLVESQLPEYAVWKKWLRDHGPELGVG